MNCQNVCKLCKNLVISTGVVFNSTNKTLNIILPNPTEGYRDGEKVCIIVAQSIPEATTRTALVNIIIGSSIFPLIKCNCTQATACEIGTRRKYSTRVITNLTSGVFKLLSPISCIRPDNLQALPITTATVSRTKKESVANE